MSNKTDQSSAIRYPCEFTVKVICHANKGLIPAMLSIVKKHFPETTMEHIKCRESKESKYTALSITVNAQNQEQLDQLYQNFSDSDNVLMTL